MPELTSEMFNWPHAPDENTYREAARHAAEDERLKNLWTSLKKAHGQYRSAMLSIHQVEVGEDPETQPPQKRPNTTEADAMRLTYQAQEWADFTREGVMMDGGRRDEAIRKILENAQYGATSPRTTVAAFQASNDPAAIPRIAAWLISKNPDWAGLNPHWPNVEGLNVYVVEDHDHPGVTAFINAVQDDWGGTPLPEGMGHIETIARYHGAPTVRWIAAKDLPEEIRPRTRQELKEESDRILGGTRAKE